MKYLSTLILIFNLAFTLPALSDYYRDSSFPDERIQNFKTGWVVNEKLLAQRCFVQEWFSSDNFQAIAEHFKIEDEDDFFINPGLYIGSKLNSYEPLELGLHEKVFFTMKIEDCIATPEAKVMHDGTVVEIDPEYDIENYYRLLHTITTEVCNELAPNANSECLEAYLIRVGEETGGSIGDKVAFGIYGLFDLPKVGLSIVPLKYFGFSESYGLDFIYDDECPANKAIYTSSDNSTIFKTTHFAVKRALFCNYFDKDNEPERGGANFQFWLPKEGYFNTMRPDYNDLDIEEKPHEIDCRESKTVMLKGKVDDETVYIWNERRLALPCCMTFSLSEKDFEEKLEKRGFSDDFIWLQDELVPNAEHEIDTISNQIYHPDYKQPLGNDVLGITGCEQNETLYGDKYLEVSKRKAVKYAAHYEEVERIIKEYDGEILNGKNVGHWRYYDKTGKIWHEGSYKDGEKDGLWREYDTDGAIVKRERWSDGVLENSQGEMLNGVKVGNWRYYDDFGYLQSWGSYKDGKKDGPWREHDKKGSYKDGKKDGLWIGHDTKGSYNDGKKDGIWTVFEKDGSLSVKETWIDGMLVGPWISYVSGKVSAEGQYDNDAKSGHWKYYDNAGKLWSEGSYKDGKKDGVWTTYDTDGSISETATWVDGELEGA